MNSIHLILLTLLVTATSVFAQNTPERTCRILFLDRPDDAPKTLHLFDGVSSREVELPGMNLSPVYKLPSGPLKLLLLPAPVSDPITVSPDAPSVLVPEACTDFYLLVSSDPDNKLVTPVSMNVIEANHARVGRGQMLWFNLTDKTVGGTVGSEKITLKPDACELIKEPRDGKGDYPVDLYFMIEGDDLRLPLCETQWRHDPRSRCLVIIMPDKKRRAPRVFAFSDFRQPDGGG